MNAPAKPKYQPQLEGKRHSVEAPGSLYIWADEDVGGHGSADGKWGRNSK